MNREILSIRERYLSTLDRIAEAARASDRKPEDVRLVVVSKGQPPEVIRAAIQAGIKLLGENYPEEAIDKINTLGFQTGVEWHMIGHVQSRKAQMVIDHFNLLHSLDSLKLARRLDQFCKQKGRILPVLLEFNMGGEQNKSGWPAPYENHWPDLVGDLASLEEFSSLRVQGVMSMPPLGENAESSRPYFERTRKLLEFLSRHLPGFKWNELSMGTSLDYEVAVEEGATLVRVGTAILGPRR